MRCAHGRSAIFQVCKEDTVDFQAPVVKAEPEICSPRVGGEMRKGGQLSSEGPMPLTVRYNCHAPGETVITMRIGKRCTGDSRSSVA